MVIFKILIIIGLLISLSVGDVNMWRDYPTCKIGRLQSPIKIKEYESIYANNFSFVYQNYKNCLGNKKDNYAYTIEYDEGTGGYVNFERGGVIKQYEFIRAELYPALHEIDGKKGDYELHLIHQKNLDFVTNKNQYRSIQDPNMYLVIVLRYQNCNGNGKVCTNDNGLLGKLIPNPTSINLNEYNIFQDKRAYFYEGSFLYAPCDENVNYYVINDFFNSDGFNQEIINNINDFNVTVNEQPKYGRPVLKNFMNYREFLESKFYEINIYSLFFMLVLFFL